jgi:TonB family protein
MAIRNLLVPAAVMSFSWCGTTHAQFRCDCTSVVHSCSADVAIRGSFVEITTDRQQCARVDYFIDGQPFVSVAVDGSDRQDWIARTGNPRIMVQSCQVCRENSASTAPVTRSPTTAPQAQSQSGDSPLQPLIKFAPIYPSAAQARGQQGYVEVEFTLTPAGDVQNPRVVAAQPTNVFDQAALAAVSRWRYPADPARSEQTVKERVEFSSADARAAAPASPARSVAPATGPRNQCVREGSVYNFGESIDIGLMNACQEPLMVFGCAQGTGRYLGRWVCVDSETQANVLVPPADQRVGGRASVNTPDGTRTYTYADSLVVTRAPNSQYWWIACGATDAACRDEARQWTRSVDRQLATVDPQDRSRISVAGSN